MDLVLVSQDFPPDVGGIETYAAELSKRLHAHCDQFFVVAPDKEKADEVDAELPFAVKRVPVSNALLGFRGILSVPSLLSRSHIDMVFHTQWQTLPISVFARRYGSVRKIFAAAHARELLFNPLAGLPVLEGVYEKYKRWLLDQVDLFFPVSEYTADLLKQHGIPEDKIQVVINGTDPNRFYPQDTQAARQSIDVEAPQVMLTVTRLVARKGVDTALRAFQKVLERYPDCKYVIGGSGPYKPKLQRLAEELGISQSVIFAGRIPDEELLSYYNACDVFVMPSKTEPPNVEGFGIVFLEANACGKPVIGSYSGGIPSAVVEGETGLLVEEQNPEALAAAIEKLLADPALAKELGTKGRRRVEQTANWEASAAKLREYISREVERSKAIS